MLSYVQHTFHRISRKVYARFTSDRKGESIIERQVTRSFKDFGCRKEGCVGCVANGSREVPNLSGFGATNGFILLLVVIQLKISQLSWLSPLNALMAFFLNFRTFIFKPNPFSCKFHKLD